MGEEELEGTKEAASSPDDIDVFDNSGYKINNNKFLQISHSKKKDEVDGGYRVDTSKPLPDFDNFMSKAYEVVSSKENDAVNLYAVVLDKKYPIRLAEINKLLGRYQEGFVNVMAAQLMKSSLGKGNFFTVILEKPSGMKISEYIEKNAAISSDAIAIRMVPPINRVIDFLVKRGVVHGRINADNVYIDSNAGITVGECISEACGLSQPVLYEDMNRSLAHPMGKGDGHLGATDYHALGVLSIIMLKGGDPFEGVPESEIVKLKFSSNTYKILAHGMELSPHMMDFLGGVVNDKAKEVWGSSHVEEWSKGRRFNLLPPAENVDAGRPILFAGTKHINMKSLAHDMYMHWDDAKKFIREDTLERWIERSVQDVDLSEKMEVLANRSGPGTDAEFDKDDELLAQYIMLLDPTGPIRLRGFSSFLDGLGVIMPSGYTNNKKQYLEAVSNIIHHSLASYLNMELVDDDEGNSKHHYAFTLQRCSELLRKNGYGFGLERCLYELNLTLPCQSPTVIDDSVFSVSELLVSLNKNNNISGKILDEKMAAFLATRMELQVGIRVTSLSRFPDFAGNLYIQTLALLSLAQQVSQVGRLRKLSTKVSEGLFNVIEGFHSKFVRDDIAEALAKESKKGSLSEILKIITNTQNLVRDRLGFRRAVAKYKNNAMQIAKLANRKAINNTGYRYGLQLSVMLSFFFATVVIIVLMLKAF